MFIYPSVSIIFPIYKGWKDAQDCLKSIAHLDYPKEKIEVIIINNGSEKVKSLPSPAYRQAGGQADQKSKVKSQKLRITFIKNRTNLGFAKAVNQGIRKARGEYVLITNDDVVFDKDYLKILVDYLQRQPKVGIVGGKVFYRKPKGKISFAGGKFDFYTGRLSFLKHPDKISPTDWVTGCNFLVRKKVINQIGLFDEKFFFYFEDFDFCLRAKKAGWQVIYFPQAVMWHQEGSSIDQESWQKKSDYYYAGKTRLLLKHGNSLQILSCFAFQFLLGLPYHLLILKHNNYPAAFKALWKNLKI